MKHSTGTPTKAEAEWMHHVSELGCIVCLNQGHKTPCAVHHILRGGIRMGHMYTIGLCDPGHHQNAGLQPGSGKISRHPNKARFEAEYGTELELLEQTRELLGVAA